MKFGKHLQKRQLDIPEYAASFVNYKALKKLIKQLSSTPTLLPQNAASTVIEVLEPQAALQANRATFFFRLERELERVNAFYLQKEAELILRLKTLLDKKKVMQGRSATASKLSASFVTLEEGFQQFCNDLNKLQQFVEINNTAFSKILKKWDKTSKSRTKELYLSRAVEVQPCFNRDIISDLSDQATTSLQELAAWAEGENIRYDSSRPIEHTVTGQPIGIDNDDTDSQISHAANTGNTGALQEWITKLQASPDARERFTRTFLVAISDAPDHSLEKLLSSGLVDLQAEDEINERNCLHEAAISGRVIALHMGVTNHVDVSRADVYGRIPLHYACMYGHVEMVRVLLQINKETINDLDHDNFTPIIHAVTRHKLECARQLLNDGARLDPDGESDHIPLNLACQYGSTAIAKLLLERNAELLPDAEGLYPQHLVARSGQTPELLLVLEQYGANLDQRDKLYQWTPLFHAASEGRVDCMRILLQRGVNVTLLDEKGYSAMYYATWEGHLECMKLLGSMDSIIKDEPRSRIAQSMTPWVHENTAAATTGADGIPDLSLPPPIIPLRRYGHNFLDNKTFIQISFEPFGSEAIIFYHDSKYPAARLTISSKSSDVIPRNIMLPIQEDSKFISFQIDGLNSFAVDFDIYPTFGSKMIARSVALPSLFSTIAHSSSSCCLPLFDPRLRAIGQISFEYKVIKPFQGMPLDITHFATYWRASSQLDAHPTGFITGSSLSGNYVRLFVQLTRDGVPVLCPKWSINHHGIEQSIVRLTCEQYKSLGSSAGKRSEDLMVLTKMSADDIVEIHQLLASSSFTLSEVLSYLPTSVHVNVQVLFPTAHQERTQGLGPSPNINDFADAILKDVFEHARYTKGRTPDFMRSVVFSSYNADLCTALNWKQPNYPVLLSNDLGSTRQSNNTRPRDTGAKVSSSGHNSMSFKEAVRIAQSNNFMGLICNSQLLNMVPALIDSIKVAGLVLVLDTSEDNPQVDTQVRDYSMSNGSDGVLRSNGVLRFNQMIDM